MRNRWSLLSLTFYISGIFFNPNYSFAADPVKYKVPEKGNKSGLIPVATDKKAATQGGSVDDLFPINKPVVNNPTTGSKPPENNNGNGNSNSGNASAGNNNGSANPNNGGQGNKPQNPSNGNNQGGNGQGSAQRPNQPQQPNNGGGSPRPNNPNVNNSGNNRPSNNQPRPNNNNNGGNAGNISSDPAEMEIATVSDQFQCNLFENPDYEEIMSSLNALNQAVGTAACGQNKTDVQSIVDNNQKVKNAVTQLRGFIDNPDAVTAEQMPEVANQVDEAIRAAASIAQSFAQSDVFNDQCRKSMDSGQVALAINDLLNGLTPYAMMAATMTGGTAAIPFIVGGSVITNAVSSIGKVIQENTLNIQDPKIRRAIVTNTCQYIRLDQKYKFLIKSRAEQIRQISKDLGESEKLFSVKRKLFSAQTNLLLDQRAVLNQISSEVNVDQSVIKPQIESDKLFINNTKDPVRVCQLGIQLSLLKKEDGNYVNVARRNLEKVAMATGGIQNAQAKALGASIEISVAALSRAGAEQSRGDSISYNRCAANTRTLVESVEQASGLTQVMVRTAQSMLERQLTQSKEYNQLKAEVGAINRKNKLAKNVTNSLDNLRKYADSLTQSEIDSELERVRAGLVSPRFLGSGAPILSWFQYVGNLHNSQVRYFKTGMSKLRERAYRYTKSGIKNKVIGIFSSNAEVKQVEADVSAARNLQTFNLDVMPIGSEDQVATCRELHDVWYRWVAAIDHLQAIESFCSMINPYIYDGRASDKELVYMCRGRYVTSQWTIESQLKVMKQSLVKDFSRDWAIFVQKKMDDLLCPLSTDLK